MPIHTDDGMKDWKGKENNRRKRYYPQNYSKMSKHIENKLAYWQEHKTFFTVFLAKNMRDFKFLEI